MDITQNNFADNDPFNDKKSIYGTTSMKMLQDISTKGNWKKEDIIASKQNMLDMACKIFRA